MVNLRSQTSLEAGVSLVSSYSLDMKHVLKVLKSPALISKSNRSGLYTETMNLHTRPTKKSAAPPPYYSLSGAKNVKYCRYCGRIVCKFYILGFCTL